MTREEALDLISDVEKFYYESADEYGYYCYEAESVIDKIYDSFEEAMKAKDEEIERLKAELNHYKELANDLDNELRNTQYELNDLKDKA